MMLEFKLADSSKELDDLAKFLSGNNWPYHVNTQLSYSDARSLIISDSSEQLLYWIADGLDVVGLLRVLDIDDIGDGAPVLDIRIAEAFRGQGFGTQAVKWIVKLLFEQFRELHRIEANTREDNASMKGALEKSGFLLEGRLRQTWKLDDGGWADSLVYGLLRQDIGWRDIMTDDGTANEKNDAQLMVRHNRRLESVADEDDDFDIEMSVRHNRPAPAGEIELMVRHNRRMPALDAGGDDADDLDRDVVLTVRHNRPMTDMDIGLTVRHNRPVAQGEIGDDQVLDVRHNRPFVDVDDDAHVELTVRHNRPMS